MLSSSFRDYSYNCSIFGKLHNMYRQLTEERVDIQRLEKVFAHSIVFVFISVFIIIENPIEDA